VPSQGPTTQSSLIEADLDVDGVNVLFGRAEYARKSGLDLVLTPGLEGDTFGMAAIAAGYARHFAPVGPLIPVLGLRASLNVVGSQLGP
jgi:hypothetical protein